MITVDTNIIARIVLDDTQKEARLAERILTAYAEKEGVCIPPYVLLELVWVLGRKQLQRGDIVSALKSLLALKNVVIVNREVVTCAVDAYAQGKAGFADYLILAEGRMQGARLMASFDKDLCNEQDDCLPPDALQ